MDRNKSLFLGAFLGENMCFWERFWENPILGECFWELPLIFGNIFGNAFGKMNLRCRGKEKDFEILAN